MNYEIIATPTFRKELKRMVKKYHSLKSDLATLFETLAQEPTQGIALGHNCYKIRLSITSKGKGKSGGARVITYFVIADATVFLISIYDKSEKENLTDLELKSLLKGLN